MGLPVIDFWHRVRHGSEESRGRITTPGRPLLSPWRFVAAFGVVSLLADFVYEGARSVTGPLLASFGATAVVVGLVTGIGEAAALLLRFVSGPLSDRSRRFWAWTIAGYALTVISVPILGFSGVLSVAVGLVIAERVGKAVRSPAKDAILSFATSGIGRGKGFAIQEALDQIGAIIGPLVVAGMLAVTGERYGPSLAVLAAPGVATLALVVWLRHRVPEPQVYEPAPAASASKSEGRRLRLPQLPATFWAYSAFTATTTLGFATFGLLSYHMVERHLVPIPVIPLLYAGVMAIDALTALVTGWAFDHVGPRVLIALPVVAALVPVFAFTDAVGAVVVGSLLWGVALGVQESTLRATVAGLVPPQHRGTAFGAFAAVLGTGTAVGGSVAGALYGVSIPLVIGFTIVVQAVAVILFFMTVVAGSHRAGSVRSR